MLFSRASLPYLSISFLSFASWVRQPAPPIHPPTHAIPSIKLFLRIPRDAFKKSRFAFFYAVARKRINGEIYILLLNCLTDSLRNAAASCKYSAVIGSIVKNILRKLGKLYITRVNKSLKLLKGENAVDILCDSFLLRLGIFLPYKGL